MEGRALYDKEYGSHMKQDLNRVSHKSDQLKSSGNEGSMPKSVSMSKNSAFGNFFTMVN